MQGALSVSLSLNYAIPINNRKSCRKTCRFEGSSSRWSWINEMSIIWYSRCRMLNDKQRLLCLISYHLLFEAVPFPHLFLSSPSLFHEQQKKVSKAPINSKEPVNVWHTIKWVFHSFYPLPIQLPVRYL